MATAIIATVKAVVAFVASSAIAQGVLAVAASVLLSKAMTPKVQGGGANIPRDVLLQSSIIPKVIVYGEAVVGGALVYFNTRTTTISNVETKQLHMLAVVAAHEVEDITEVHLDDEILVAGTDFTWGGEPTSGDYATSSTADLAALKLFKQHNTTSAYSELTANYPDITSAHKATGYASVLLRFSLNTYSEELFESGLPQKIRFKVKGKKIYDPRKDTTVGGSGSHRHATPSTWEWSDNPVLCAYDYATQYKKRYLITEDRCDWTNAQSDADVCDVLVEIPPAASPANTEKRYTCNGVISLGDTNQKNFEKIMSAMIGTPIKSGGLWRFKPGFYDAPTVTFTETDIVGRVPLTTSLSRRERFNEMSAVIYDPAQSYQEAEVIKSIASLVTRDGKTIRRNVRLEMTNSKTMAQRILWKRLNQNDQQMTLPLTLKWSGLRAYPGLHVAVTYPKYSFSSKAFRVISFAEGKGNAPIDVVLKEDSSTAWADPAVGDYDTLTVGGFNQGGYAGFLGIAYNVSNIGNREVGAYVIDMETNQPIAVNDLWEKHKARIQGYTNGTRFTGPVYDEGGTLMYDPADGRLQNSIVIGDGNTTGEWVGNTLIGDGQLSTGVTTDDGGGTLRSVAHGMAIGSADDGDSITFANSWGNIPNVTLFPGGLNYSSTGLSGDQTYDYTALNISTSGFDMRAKLTELSGAGTLRTDSTSSTPSSPSGLDHSINKGQTSEAYNDQYTYQFDVTVANLFIGASNYAAGWVKVGLYTNDGGGWVKRGTVTVVGAAGASSTTSRLNNTATITVDGLGLNDDFGVTLEDALVATGSSITSFDQVTYTTATAPTSVTASPSGANAIPYVVLA